MGGAGVPQGWAPPHSVRSAQRPPPPTPLARLRSICPLTSNVQRLQVIVTKLCAFPYTLIAAALVSLACGVKSLGLGVRFGDCNRFGHGWKGARWEEESGRGVVWMCACQEGAHRVAPKDRVRYGDRSSRSDIIAKGTS